MAIPVDSLINSPHESSDEDFSDSESSYSSEEESMEDEPSENINGGSLSSLRREETEPKGTEEEFWARYPDLKRSLDTIVLAQGWIPGYLVFEKLKVIGDDKAKKLNDECKALSIKELELCSQKCEVVASVISAMISGD